LSLLEKIQSPHDIKQFTPAQRLELAGEIRRTILGTVTKTGGHLATNLGAVELTVAVHTVFDAPVDQIVWDTGHQAYTHKLLTGRYGRFQTLRQAGGISGFLRRDESAYDTFGAGHAATSISAAAGMALARDVKRGKEKVVCIIGDSSIPNGMAFEALNHVGHTRTSLLVILNDNEMSISPPVGALSRYLSKIITDRMYNRARHQAGEWLKKLPGGLGKPASKLAHHLEELVKGLVAPGMFFEELGFNYVGPVDGHDAEAMINILRRVKDMEGPVLVHAVTKKGKGLTAAEKDPVVYHGAANFDVETGELRKTSAPKPTWSSAFADQLLEAAKADGRVVAITPAMIAGSSLDKFVKEIPERILDVGIAEEHAVTLAAGMATRGLKPVVCIYSTFLQRAFDQAVHDVGIQKLPVVFGMDRAGLVGDDGPTHHGVLDTVFMRAIPGMVVMAPSDENEMARMLATALAYEGPSCIRIPRGTVPFAPRGLPRGPLPLGKSQVRREGNGIVVLALGRTLEDALAAADQLQAEGHSIQVVDARFAKPLDKELILDCARNFHGLVTVEDGNKAGGFGSAVLELLAAEGVSAPVTVLGVPDEFVEHGPQPWLREKCGYDAKGIAAAVRKMLAPEKLKVS
jgi:1-deoxy-D-xylulose-5-phosphate synthase